jgi:DNA-binding NtrC family response regulator
LTIEPDDARAPEPESFALRWVFPQPPLALTWLVDSVTTFGRDPTRTVHLDSRYVSREHAIIKRSGPLFILTDVGSKNGVAVNGRTVSEAALSPGDVVRLGDFVAVCVSAPMGADLSSGSLGPGIYGGFRLRQAVERLRELAPTDLPVVLEGQTGTGKETFARALHAASGRHGPFRAVNCAVYSKDMAAAELFGYRKGAFTGAASPSLGHVRAAEGGTLLLDELTELSADVQAMLLRVLENREVLALGDSTPTPINVRFLAATQIPLATAVSTGRLRADLQARLEGAVIRLPPLAESREVLLETFLMMFERQAGVRPAVRAAFAEQISLCAFPLNLRELDTLVRRIAAAYRSDAVLDRKDFNRATGSPADARLPGESPIDAGAGKAAIYRPEEVAALKAALEQARGNLTKAAAALGMSRSKAYRMLRARSRVAAGGSGLDFR